MVATDLEKGDKVVLKSGSLFDALRATMSVPGLFAPARVKDRWLVDGGLLDPVPVGVARAMGADIVIAVDLNSTLTSKRTMKKQDSDKQKKPNNPHEPKGELLKKLTRLLRKRRREFQEKNERLKRESATPELMDTVLASIESDAAADHPGEPCRRSTDILIQPRLGEMKRLDFDQVQQLIEEGYLGLMTKKILKRR